MTANQSIGDSEKILTPPPWPLVTTGIHFRIAFVDGADLPHWKGSLLRGVLGHGLQSLGAAAPCPTWPGLHSGCSLQEALFDPQKAWNSPRATAPWTLRCTDERAKLTAQDTVDGIFFLHGSWPEWSVAGFQDAFEAGLALGLGAKRHPSRLLSWEQKPINIPTTTPGSTATLTLRTPARLRSSNADCRGLQAGVVSRGLLRRADQLCRQLTGSRWLPDADYPTIAAYSDLLQTLANTDDHTLIARWSNRQERTVVMDAVAGSITLGGPYLATCWPWLRLAPILNLGKQPNLGMGICDLSFEQQGM